MGQCTREAGKRASSMAMGSLSLRMGMCMKACGSTGK